MFAALRSLILATAVATGFATAAFAGIAPPPIAPVALLEFGDETGGEYVIANYSNLESFGPPFSIFGFAVTNDGSEAAFTFRSGWVADVISQDSWDAGYDVTLVVPGDPGIITLFSTSDLGSFDSLFGTGASQVNMYWAGVYFGSDIGPGEVGFSFFWSASPPASEYIAFGSRGDVLYQSFDPGTVPEPAMLTLFSFGVLGLAALRRRRT